MSLYYLWRHFKREIILLNASSNWVDLPAAAPPQVSVSEKKILQEANI